MFSEIMRKILDGTAGGVGAVLMGYDGIAIEEYFKPCEGVDLHLIAVEYANVLKEIKKTAEILQTGIMEEVSVKTERFQVVIRTITDDYFVALTLAQGGNFGKARYLLKLETQSLREALA